MNIVNICWTGIASELDPESIIEEFKHLNNTQRRLEL